MMKNEEIKIGDKVYYICYLATPTIRAGVVSKITETSQNIYYRLEGEISEYSQSNISADFGKIKNLLKQDLQERLSFIQKRLLDLENLKDVKADGRGVRKNKS